MGQLPLDHLVQRLERAAAARPTTRTCSTATRAAPAAARRAAAAANLATVTIGTETDGSIVCPSGANGIVGIKPTLGLVSRAGVVPISAQQDTAGPMTRNVTDAAAVLSVIQGVDPRDPATAAGRPVRATATTCARCSPDALRGKRIGVWRRRRRRADGRPR